MSNHRRDRVKARAQHEHEEEEAREMDEEARTIPRARLGVPGRGTQSIAAGGRPATDTGEVERR